MEVSDVDDAEYWVYIQCVTKLALTSRYGPADHEVASFPWWKRIAVKATPTHLRWRYSSLAPQIRQWNDEHPVD